MTEIPQTQEDDLDQLRKLLADHGLTVAAQGSFELIPAYFLFTTADDAVKFLSLTAQRSNYLCGDEMAMTVTPPLSTRVGPMWKVSWLPVYTRSILTVWQGKPE